MYHTKCIDPWLTKNRRVCPICKRKVFARGEPHTRDDSDSESESDDTTPLINPQNRGTQGGTFREVENPFRRAVRSISQQSGAVGATNLVTASDHHSINGDYESSSQGGESEVGHIQDEFRAHVHTADTTSESSAEDCRINVRIV